ncbi:MAG: Xaa-Pro peptidase family protein [Bacteroidales bacterium]|nr:Xaa-Pro peptidase family protein [Bacteroidales bacterium]
MSEIIQKGWEEEIAYRVERIAASLAENGIDAILVSSNANLYYTVSRVIAGYCYITAQGEVKYFVRRPIGLEGDNVHYIRKPEQIMAMLGEKPKTMAVEYAMSYADVQRLKAAFDGVEIVDGTSLMNKVRAVKSQFEIDLIRRSGISHVESYRQIPHFFSEGMTDVEFQIELEHRLRLNGCLGLFRIAGQSMELFMGNILCGNNADNPTPYDFAMGGAGIDKSLPIGANGSMIRHGMTLMVDACGNFNGYMTDMSRSYKIGPVSELAEKAHQCSVDICKKIFEMARPDVAAHCLYDVAIEMAEKAGLSDYFMGHAQKAGFIGHGVGIEINELPVLSARSKDVLEEGNVIAVEPKFVIPEVGAVGIENTYVITADGAKCLTEMPEELMQLAE